jgi:hypothetical protein
MIRNLFICVLVYMCFFAGSSQASTIYDGSSGLSSPATVINFNDGASRGLKTGDKVTDQWKEYGVTFSDGTVKWSNFTMFGSPGLYGSVFTGSPGSIYFDRDVTAAAFQYFTLPTWASSITIEAKDDGNVIQTITIPRKGNYLSESELWYGFTSIKFDEIDIKDGAILWNLDNLQYTPVPIPAAFWLLGSGMLGVIGLKRKARI